jgi:hypothetical protein
VNDYPPVTGSIPGVTTTPGYEHWYFNTYQAYQDPQGYRNILMHYDKGGTTSPYQWPGQHFNVPLFITEMGISRSNADPQVAPKNKGQQPAAANDVADLLAALAETRARKADLERQEKELVAATQAKLREHQEALEELRKRARDSGIDTDPGQPVPPISTSTPTDSTTPRPSEPPSLSN